MSISFTLEWPIEIVGFSTTKQWTRTGKEQNLQPTRDREKDWKDCTIYGVRKKNYVAINQYHIYFEIEKLPTARKLWTQPKVWYFEGIV